MFLFLDLIVYFSGIFLVHVIIPISLFFRDKLFPESSVRNITYQVLQGLAFMHKHGKLGSAPTRSLPIPVGAFPVPRVPHVNYWVYATHWLFTDILKCLFNIKHFPVYMKYAGLKMFCEQLLLNSITFPVKTPKCPAKPEKFLYTLIFYFYKNVLYTTRPNLLIQKVNWSVWFVGLTFRIRKMDTEILWPGTTFHC